MKKTTSSSPHWTQRQVRFCFGKGYANKKTETWCEEAPDGESGSTFRIAEMNVAEFFEAVSRTYKPRDPKEEKCSSGWLSWGVQPVGGRRLQETASDFEVLAVDLDDIPEAELERIFRALSRLGIAWKAVTTFSDGLKTPPGCRRVRIWTVLSRKATKAEFFVLVNALDWFCGTWEGDDGRPRGWADARALRPQSVAYLLPDSAADRMQTWEDLSGLPLDVDAMLPGAAPKSDWRILPTAARRPARRSSLGGAPVDCDEEHLAEWRSQDEATQEMRIARALLRLANKEPAVEGEHGRAQTILALRIGHDFAIPLAIWLVHVVDSAWNALSQPSWVYDDLAATASGVYRSCAGEYGESWVEYLEGSAARFAISELDPSPAPAAGISEITPIARRWSEELATRVERELGAASEKGVAFVAKYARSGIIVVDGTDLPTEGPARGPLVLAWSTGSGKTTFGKDLIDSLPPKARVKSEAPLRALVQEHSARFGLAHYQDINAADRVATTPHSAHKFGSKWDLVFADELGQTLRGLPDMWNLASVWKNMVHDVAMNPFVGAAADIPVAALAPLMARANRYRQDRGLEPRTMLYDARQATALERHVVHTHTNVGKNRLFEMGKRHRPGDHRLACFTSKGKLKHAMRAYQKRFPEHKCAAIHGDTQRPDDYNAFVDEHDMIFMTHAGSTGINILTPVAEMIVFHDNRQISGEVIMQFLSRPRNLIDTSVHVASPLWTENSTLEMDQDQVRANLIAQAERYRELAPFVEPDGRELDPELFDLLAYLKTQKNIAHNRPQRSMDRAFDAAGWTVEVAEIRRDALKDEERKKAAEAEGREYKSEWKVVDAPPEFKGVAKEVRKEEQLEMLEATAVISESEARKLEQSYRTDHKDTLNLDRYDIERFYGISMERWKPLADSLRALGEEDVIDALKLPELSDEQYTRLQKREAKGARLTEKQQSKMRLVEFGPDVGELRTILDTVEADRNGRTRERKRMRVRVQHHRDGGEEGRLELELLDITFKRPQAGHLTKRTVKYPQSVVAECVSELQLALPTEETSGKDLGALVLEFFAAKRKRWNASKDAWEEKTNAQYFQIAKPRWKPPTTAAGATKTAISWLRDGGFDIAARKAHRDRLYTISSPPVYEPALEELGRKITDQRQLLDEFEQAA